MKHHTLINIALATAAGAAIIAGGCAKGSTGASGEKSSDATTAGVKTSGEYFETSATYLGFNGLDSCTLTLSVSVDWPEAFGSADVKPLQEALAEAAFNSRSGRGIKEVVDSFITETASYDLGVDNSITEIPAGVNPLYAYQREVTVQRGELSLNTVTYNIYDMSYMGGAHPMTYTRSITYAFEQHAVVSNDNLFNADKMDAVFSAVNSAAAAQFGVAKGELTKAGFMEDAIPVSPLVSLSRGAIVFHYNPYDVGPYSMGAVDIYVSPESVGDALSPLGKLLLDQQK